MMSEHMCRDSILPRSAGLSLRFQLAGYMQLEGGELNSLGVLLVSFSFCFLGK